MFELWCSRSRWEETSGVIKLKKYWSIWWTVIQTYLGLHMCTRLCDVIVCFSALLTEELLGALQRSHIATNLFILCLFFLCRYMYVIQRNIYKYICIYIICLCVWKSNDASLGLNFEWYGYFSGFLLSTDFDSMPPNYTHNPICVNVFLSICSDE